VDRNDQLASKEEANMKITQDAHNTIYLIDYSITL